MNNEAHKQRAAKVSGLKITDLTNRAEWVIYIAVIILMVLSFSACYYGAYSEMIIHFENEIVAHTLALLIASLSELLASYFFFYGFGGIFSYFAKVEKRDKNTAVVGSIMLAIAILTYSLVTYRYTTRGVVKLSRSNDNSEQINLTYSFKKDSINLHYTGILDSIKAEQKFNYDKFDSLTNAGVTGLALKNANNRVNTNASRITNFEAAQRDALADLDTERKKDLLRHQTELNSNEKSTFNLALITLFGVPFLWLAYAYLMMLVVKTSEKTELQLAYERMEVLTKELNDLKKKLVGGARVLTTTMQ